PGSVVPAWVDVVTVPNGCVVMGTAPISGEYYEFALPGFHFAYPFNYDPVVFSGSVMGTYGFDPLPEGVGLSGLAWHQIEKIHDPSTEADILNAEFIGIEPLTGQLYRILLPQGALEGSGGDVVAPPETSIEGDTITAEGTPLGGTLVASRPDIAAVLNANATLRFGDLAVQANRDILVSAPAIVDATGATVLPIGGPSGSTIPNGALLKVNASGALAIDLPGVQASFLALDSDLRPAIPGVEPGQVDHGALWVTGPSTGAVAVVDTAEGAVSQLLQVPGASALGGVGLNGGNGNAYVAGLSLQNVAIYGTGAVPPERAPWIWSPGLATFYVNAANSLTVLATGWPQPALSISGTLPQGLTFQDNGNGTGTLAGSPAAGTGGDYALTFTATSRLGSVSKALVLSIAEAPLFTGPTTATFFVGALGTFTVTTTGSPSITTMWMIAGALPAGLTFVDNGDGTGSILGTAAAGTEGSYTITLQASTGAPPDAVQAFTIVVNPPVPTAPVITSASSATYQLGIEPTFIFTAIGFPTPALSYTGALPAAVSFTDNGDGSASLEGFPDAPGTYTIVLKADNGVPPAATQTFNLIILPVAGTPPAITLQPVSQTVNPGQTATFTAAASGNPIPTVQWQRSTDGGVTFGNISGATGATYTTPSATTIMNGYQFRAVFTSSAGSATTLAATLTVNGPTGTAPIVTAQPANQTVAAGQTAIFTAAASGSPTPTVQWEVSTDGASWSIIAGATSTSYTTPATTAAMNGYRYRAVFTNALGTAYTNTATLSVMTPPSVTAQPTNQSVTAGQTATFTAAASGNPAPSIQWQLSTDGATWSNISGATGTSYTTSATTTAMNGYRYRAVFANSAGTATSNAATLAVGAQVPTLVVVTTSVPDGRVGQEYPTQQLAAQGGTAPYAWTLGASRALPNGLRLSSAGVISGTPRAAGTYAFVVVVTDAAGRTANQTLTMTIAPRR
ncbi:MAG TPA: immunoglobulin domain-containing protein, partial [Candidatus Limnocylindrales bacterium]|nr:immunoglobulin domain-containing protein [Candidatus Limnocylindrales bacterium]